MDNNNLLAKNNETIFDRIKNNHSWKMIILAVHQYFVLNIKVSNNGRYVNL